MFLAWDGVGCLGFNQAQSKRPNDLHDMGA